MNNLGSLFIYLFVFLMSAYFLNDEHAFLSRNTIEENKKYVLNKKNNGRIYAILGLIILIVFAAGRYKVGTDFWQYEFNFRRYANMSLGSFISDLRINSEPIFAIIARFAYKIGGRVLCWACVALLTLIPIYVVLKRDYPLIAHGTAMAVYLLSGFSDAFNLSKEYIAISFVFLSIGYIFKNQKIGFILSIILASMFHSSALIMLLMWFFWDHKTGTAISGLRTIIFITISVIVTYYYQDAIRFISSRISFFSLYSIYAEEINARNRDFYVSLLILAIMLVTYRQVREYDNRASFFLLLYIISTIIGFTGFSHPQVKRIGLYFSIPSTVFYCGCLPTCTKEGQSSLVSALIIFFYILLFVLVYYILGQSHLLPYHFDLTSPV